MAGTGGSPKTRRRFVHVRWIALGAVVLILFALTVWLFVKSDFLSTGRLTDEETKTLWALLGIALVPLVTLIGTLLNDQSNRKQQALARETEQRLKIDTVAKVLELITIDGADVKYAPRARVAGAIATMMQLQGGPVAVRILGELWAADAVDSHTAIWLIDQVLRDAAHGDWQAPEVEDATWLLSRNAKKLVPERTEQGQTEENQSWYLWPTAVEDGWPEALPDEPRKSLVLAAVKVLLAREISYWKFQGHRFPINTLFYALDDSPGGGRSDGFRPEVAAARALATLLDSGALATLDAVNDTKTSRIHELSQESVPLWVGKLVSKFEPWANDRPTDQDRVGS